MRRRRLLSSLGVTSLGLSVLSGQAAPTLGGWTWREVPALEPVWQLCAGGPSGLLGLGSTGALLALSLTQGKPRQLAEGLDPATPLAAGHARLAARLQDGGLWVWSGEAATTLASARLSIHAGLLIEPRAVVGVKVHDGAAADSRGHRVARFEWQGEDVWREVAASHDDVLADARPFLADLEGRADAGHIVVLAGPDGVRYGHGVLGDTIEATRVLWLDRRSLAVLRSLKLSAPHVFEDLAPRPVALSVTALPRSGLLTVRSGPEGGQLALITADAADRRSLKLAGLGDTVGGFHRWLAPTTDGQHWLAVHTPHIGGVLHVYRREGQQLARQRLTSDVSTHRIGSRVIDLSVWLRSGLALPSQDGRRLRVLDPAAQWTERASVALPDRVAATVALADQVHLAARLDDGRVVLAGPRQGG